MVNTTDARCLAPSPVQANFNSFIQTCANSADASRQGLTFVSAYFDGLFENEEQQSTKLLSAIDSIATFISGQGIDTRQIDGQLLGLKKSIEQMTNEISERRTQIETYNQKFMDRLIDAPKSTSRLGNLQDVSLTAFFGSLIFLALTLTVVQYLKVNGSVVTAIATLLGFTIFTLAIYALLRQVA